MTDKNEEIESSPKFKTGELHEEYQDLLQYKLKSAVEKKTAAVVATAAGKQRAFKRNKNQLPKAIHGSDGQKLEKKGSK